MKPSAVSLPAVVALVLGFALASGPAFVAPLAAQLEPASEPVPLGPLGGSTSSILVDAFNPNVILLATYTVGLMRSVDGGITFAPFGTGLTNGVEKLVRDPTSATGIYALDGMRLMHSSDAGATWSVRFTSTEELKRIALPAVGDDVLVIDAFNAWHSPDGSTPWTLASSVVPFAGDFFDSVAYSADGSTAYLGTLTRGVLKSTDGGLSFVDAGPFSTWTQCLTVSPTQPNLVFAGTFSGLTRSTDGGVTFQAVTNPVAAGNSEWFAPAPDGLWYGTLTSVVFTPDDGNTWINATGGWPVNTPLPLTVATGPNGKRYLGCDGGGLYDQSGGGLYRMPAGTPTTWEHIGFLTALIRDVAVAQPGGLRVLALGGGVYAGLPGAAPTPTEFHADLGADTRVVAVDPADATRWISGGVGAFFDNAIIYVETGNGAAFTKAYERSGAGVVKDLAFDPSNPNKLVAGIFPGDFGNAAILRSTDRGSSWIEVPGTTAWGTQAVAFDPFVPGRVVQLAYNNRWAVSTNSGQAWGPLQAPWPGSGIAMLLAFDPFEPGLMYRGDTGSGLWRSSNGGASWQSLGVGLHENNDLLLHPQFPHMMWVSDASGHVLVSTDHGDSFHVALDVPLGANGAALALDTASGTLEVGTTSASLWELPGGCPVVKLGAGTAGTAGFAPRHFLSGGLPQLGSTTFAIGGDRFLGGAPAFLAYGLSETNVPKFGGSFHVGTLLDIVAFPIGGAPGVGGAGTFSIPALLPLDPVLVGVSVVTQCAALDAGAAHPSGITLSNAIRFTFHN